MAARTVRSLSLCPASRHVLPNELATSSARIARPSPSPHLRRPHDAELFEDRRWANGDLGLALIRNGNETRSFETLLRYRGAALAECTRALRTLEALRTGQPVGAGVLELRQGTPSPGAPSSAERTRRERGLSSAAHQIDPRAGASRQLSAASSTCSPTEPGSPSPCTSLPRPGRRTNPRRTRSLSSSRWRARRSMPRRRVRTNPRGSRIMKTAERDGAGDPAPDAA